MSRIVTEIEQLYRKASQRGMSVRLTVSQANGETTTTLALTTPTANCGEPPVEKKQRSRDRQKQNSRYFFDKRKSKKEEITKPTTPKPKQDQQLDVSKFTQPSFLEALIKHTEEPKIDVSTTSIPSDTPPPTTVEKKQMKPMIPIMEKKQMKPTTPTVKDHAREAQLGSWREAQFRSFQDLVPQDSPFSLNRSTGHVSVGYRESDLRPMREEALRLLQHGSWRDLFPRHLRYSEPDLQRIREEALKFWNDPAMTEKFVCPGAIHQR